MESTCRQPVKEFISFWDKQNVRNMMYYIDECFECAPNYKRGILIREIQRIHPKLSLDLMKLENHILNEGLYKGKQLFSLPLSYGDAVLYYVATLPVNNRVPSLHDILAIVESIAYEDVLLTL